MPRFTQDGDYTDPNGYDYANQTAGYQAYTGEPQAGTGPGTDPNANRTNQIQAAYQKYLGRSASDSDIQSWIGNDQFEQGIMGSPEAKAYAAKQNGGSTPTGGTNYGSYGNIGGFDQSRLNDPNDQSGKYVFSRWILDQTGGTGQGVTPAMIQQFVASHPNWEINPNSSPNDPQIRIKPGDPSLGSKTSYWQDVIQDSGPGGKNLMQFSNIVGDPSKGYAPYNPNDPNSGGTAPGAGGGGGLITTGGLFGGNGVAPGIGSNSSSNQMDALIKQLIDRSHQSLSIDPSTDPTIRPQVEAYSAQQERSRRNYLNDLAESSNPYATGAQNTAATQTSEAAGQATGALQSQLTQNELTARRTEIQNALSEEGSLLTADQQLALQKELGYLNAALQQQQITNANDQFNSQLGLNATNQSNYWDAIRSGLL